MRLTPNEEQQREMRHAHYDGAPGILVSGLVWIAAALVCYQFGINQAVWTLLIGGGADLSDQHHGDKGSGTTREDKQSQCTEPTWDGVNDLAYPLLRDGVRPFPSEARTIFPGNDGNDRKPLPGICKHVWQTIFLDTGSVSDWRCRSRTLRSGSACRYRRPWRLD